MIKSPCDTHHHHHLLALSRLILSGGYLRCEWFEERNICEAYDIANNVLSLGYSVLFWKIQIALMKAKLEPYLGFLHEMHKGEPPLTCDFQDLYRYLIDDFVIEYSRSLKPKDFIQKSEDYSSNRKGKREYLNDHQTRDFTKKLDECFLTEVKIPRYRMGKKQELETLINEEAMLLAKFLRGEKSTWSPRTANFF